MSGPGWGRVIGVGIAVAGATAAAAAGGLVAQRTLVARRARQGEQLEFGTLRAEPRTVIADDGVVLHVEVDEAPGVSADEPTLVFVHGYTLDLDCWHFQRAALRRRYRLVFYDQRSHGRSGRSSPERSTIEQLGHDLATVIQQLVPTGPLVLVGHSMGGMTVMAWAEQHPEAVARRLVGVALMATSADEAAQLLPGRSGRLLDRTQPVVMAALARVPWLVERGRRSTAFALTKQLAFGGPVPDSYVVFVDQMISNTPSDVIWDFLPSVCEHRRSHVLAEFGDVPALVAGGRRDHVLPFSHTEHIAAAIPHARVLDLDDAGHMLILERHIDVTDAIADLVAEAARLGRERL